MIGEHFPDTDIALAVQHHEPRVCGATKVGCWGAGAVVGKETGTIKYPDSTYNLAHVHISTTR